MQFIKRKKVFVPLALIAVFAVAGVAVAYWTASGTGSGTGTTGTDSGVTIAPVTTTGLLYPNGSIPVTFDVNNLSADTEIKVGKVVVDSITTSDVGCLPADFSFGDVTLNQRIPAGSSYSSAGTLAMADTAVNQDACKNATITLNLQVDNSGI